MSRRNELTRVLAEIDQKLKAADDVAPSVASYTRRRLQASMYENDLRRSSIRLALLWRFAAKILLIVLVCGISAHNDCCAQERVPPTTIKTRSFPEFEHFATVRRRLELVKESYGAGLVTYDIVRQAEEDVLEADLRMAVGPAQRVIYLHKDIASLLTEERRIYALYKEQAQGGSIDRLYAIRALRLGAQARWLREHISAMEKGIYTHPPKTLAGMKSDLKHTLLERCDALKEQKVALTVAFDNHKVTLELLLDATIQHLESQLDLEMSQTKRETIRNEILTNVTALENKAVALHEAGSSGGTLERVLGSRARRINAEIELDRERIAGRDRATSHESARLPSLLKSRYEVLQERFNAMHRDYEIRRVPLDFLIRVSKDVLSADLANASGQKERSLSLQRHLQRATRIEADVNPRITEELLQAKAHRLDAEIQLQAAGH